MILITLRRISIQVTHLNLRYLSEFCNLNTTTAYYYNRQTGWRKLPDMPRSRSNMMCGVATMEDGKRKIVMGGGTSR